MLRLVFWSLACFAITALVITKAVAAMRAGRPYRLAWYDGGVFAGREVKPAWMLAAAAAYVLLVGSILAWPLGVYEWVGEQTSGCRDLVTEAELAELGDGQLDEISVQELDTACYLRASSAAHEELEVSLDAYAVRVPEPSRAVRGPSGAELVRADDSRSIWIAFRSGHAGGYVRMPRAHFDEEDVARVIELVDARRALVAPYVEAAAPAGKGERFVRANLPYLFLGLVALLLVGGISFGVVRRNRALRRALEEEDLPEESSRAAADRGEPPTTT